jgi:hypothetical protein
MRRTSAQIVQVSYKRLKRSVSSPWRGALEEEFKIAI